MKILSFLAILGLLLFGPRVPTRADSPSDWPALGHDAGQSNFNDAESTLTGANVLKLKPKWATPIANVSYPVVAGGKVFVPRVYRGKIHVAVVDATTGKMQRTISHDAFGGLLVKDGTLWLAGQTLQAFDPSSGAKSSQIDASPAVSRGTFIDPEADSKVMLAGYTSLQSGADNTLYAVNPSTQSVLWKAPSSTALGTLTSGHVLTDVKASGVFYDESAGNRVASGPRGDHFAGPNGAYTVAYTRGGTAIYGYDKTGKQQWKRIIGPPMAVASWAHAVSSDTVFVATMTHPGVDALDPVDGSVLWHASIPDVVQIAVANNLVYALTYGLGQPVRLVILHADTGKPVGALVLSSGYYAFNSPNELMVADGMVFIRVVADSGSELVALGL